MLSSASTQAVGALGGGTELAGGDAGRTQGQRALDEYRNLLAEKLGIELVEATSRCQDITNAEGSADREDFREAAQAVTDRLTAMREEAVAPTELSTLRNEAWLRSQQRAEHEHQHELRVPASGTSERYLNAEFVAIYW